MLSIRRWAVSVTVLPGTGSGHCAILRPQEKLSEAAIRHGRWTREPAGNVGYRTVDSRQVSIPSSLLSYEKQSEACQFSSHHDT